jgi:vanillate O-demethylase ferredoxin subunit
MSLATVEAVRRLTADTIELTLAPAAGAACAAVEPGAHLRLALAGGLERSYSLCNPGPAPQRYVIAVKREVASRGGSAAVHALRAGDTVGVAGPFNAFAVDWTERRLLLVAGGIGITPIYAMAQEAARRGHAFMLHYFMRSAGDAVYLDALQRAPWAAQVRLHAGLDPAAVRAAIDALLVEADADASDGVYVCGPGPLIELTRELAAVRVGTGHVHWESFGGEGRAAPAEGAGAAADRTFEIALAGGAGPFTVPPGVSALSVLLAAGIDAPFSCREGECGMCVVDVVEGEPEHRDRFLSDAARKRGNCMTLCVSRARGARIVVDF